jgi:hypothetical protein
MTKYLDILKNEIDDSNLALTSKKVIKSTINKIQKFNDNEPNQLIISIQSFLNNNDNVNTSHTFIAHIKSLLKHTSLENMINENDKNDIHNLFIKYKNLKQKKENDEEINQKFQDNFIPYDTILNHYNKVKDNMFWKDKLMYGLYILQPPINADYGNVKMILQSDKEVYDDITHNYFLLDRSQLIINIYTNNKVMGIDGLLIHKPILININAEVYDLIYESLCVELTEFGNLRDYLIEDNRGKPMKLNALYKNISRIGKRLYNKNIGIQQLKNIYCSRFLIQNDDGIINDECRIETIINDSKNMGHSLKEHMKKYMKYYTKINNYIDYIE